MFIINKVYEPYEQNKGQDMWIVEIDQIHDEDRLYCDDNMDHTGCVEVRAMTEDLVLNRAQAIVNALNN